jgi:hypothetical protein
MAPLHMENPMISSKWPASNAAFDRFLYASVGDEAQGMPLTVLSTLARHDVDPWEQAALWCRLPLELARRQLVTMLDALPGQELLSGQEAMMARSALAAQLLPLLPRPAEIRALDGASVQRDQTTRHSTHVIELVMVGIYFFGMVLGGWWFSRDVAREVDAQTAQTAQSAQPVTTEAGVAARPIR